MKVLLLDIETAPILAHVWGLYDQNIGVNQIVRDWSILSWSAKWLDQKHIMYQDNRNSRNPRNDRKLLKGIYRLLNEADIVITQNGKAFDQKKLNARFIQHGYKPPHNYRHIDTKVIAKKHFGFTSNGLEYMSDKLNFKYKKLKHNRFPGHDLWKECLKGNLDAWKEMEKYNKYDVLSLEELYKRIQPWDNSVNPNVYTNDENPVCLCGSSSFQRRGYAYPNGGKYHKYSCNKCGKWSRGKQNLLSADKRRSMRVGA